MHPLSSLILLLLLSIYPAESVAQHGVGSRSGQQVYEYSVATLAPPGVIVPPIVLKNEMLHAVLVELAGGTSMEQVGRNIRVGTEELESLFRLIEMEGFGRRKMGGGWVPLALALDASQVKEFADVTTPLARVIADTVEARWAMLDSMVSNLPVAGRLPLIQTGFVLVGDYILGLFQYEALWQAGLGPSHRRYAYRVYRIDSKDAPPGHHVSIPGGNEWQVVRYSPTSTQFGFTALLDPENKLRTALLGRSDRAEAERMTVELIDAYRLWYLMDVPPDRTTRRILRRLEVLDEEGLLRVPLISVDDLAQMRSIALWLGADLWPHLTELMPEISAVTDKFGFGDPEMLGEVTLAAWEMAVHGALRLLVDRGILLQQVEFRGQALLVSYRQ